MTARGSLVLVRHATPRRNLGSICERGLLPELARGKTKAVWLHTPRRTDWARGHVAERHDALEVVILEVQLPRADLVRAARGLYFCRRKIDAADLVLLAEEKEEVCPF